MRLGLGKPVGARGVEPPLEDVAVDHDRPRHVAVGLSLGDRPDVHEECTGVESARHVVRLDSLQALARLREQVVDRHADTVPMR